ncbi:MAG: IclR family transcriptional regulator [Spirochaeta sp.]
MASQKKQTENYGTLGSPISSVVRAFSILELLSTRHRFNLEHLSRKSGLAKPTVYRFLNTLRDLGYVRRDDNDQYYITLKLFTIGSRALDHMDLPVIAHPVAENLSEKLHETVHMGVRDELEATYILKIESKYTLRMYSRVGRKIPLYCTAIGKALLVENSEEELQEYVNDTRLVPFTPNTITDIDSLKRELDSIRETGVSNDREEHEEGIRCIAGLIRDYTGSIVAALSVSWPTFRFDPDKENDYTTAIRSAADEISGILGWDSRTLKTPSFSTT